MSRARVVNSHQGPFFNGAGDAIVLAWVAEGSRGTEHEVQIFAKDSKRQLLELLGQPYVDCPHDALNPSEVYALEQCDQGALPRATRAASHLGVPHRPKRPMATIPQSARVYAEMFWGHRKANQQRVLLCPESNDGARRWHGWHDLQSILANLQVMTMTANNCASNWRNAAAIIEAADVVVSVDSAHGHLAGTLDRPTVVICGPTKASVFSHMPSVSTVSVPIETQWCLGCSYGPNFRGDVCWPKGCDALHKLKPEQVAGVVNERLNRKTMMYQTYGQLAENVRLWCRTLPPFAAVAGVPRAGVIVASMIAAERNIHLVTLDDLKSGRKPWQSPLRRNCPAKTEGDVFIVDDTVATGGHMATLREELPSSRFKFGAVYGMDQGMHLVDHCYKKVGNIDHVFEWNWQHHWFVEQSLFDLDGVLCEDWAHFSETGDMASRYNEHLLNAKALIVPAFPIREIVTARLEKFRPQTEQWLRKNGIQFHQLTMGPYSSPEERAEKHGFAERKAEIYKQRLGARMFVESSHHQSEIIARITGRPVLSWERQVMLNGANP